MALDPASGQHPGPFSFAQHPTLREIRTMGTCTVITSFFFFVALLTLEKI